MHVGCMQNGRRGHIFEMVVGRRRHEVAGGIPKRGRQVKGRGQGRLG